MYQYRHFTTGRCYVPSLPCIGAAHVRSSFNSFGSPIPGNKALFMETKLSWAGSTSYLSTEAWPRRKGGTGGCLKLVTTSLLECPSRIAGACCSKRPCAPAGSWPAPCTRDASLSNCCGGTLPRLPASCPGATNDQPNLGFVPRHQRTKSQLASTLKFLRSGLLLGAAVDRQVQPRSRSDAEPAPSHRVRHASRSLSSQSPAALLQRMWWIEHL